MASRAVASTACHISTWQHTTRFPGDSCHQLWTQNTPKDWPNWCDSLNPALHSGNWVGRRGNNALSCFRSRLKLPGTLLFLVLQTLAGDFWPLTWLARGLSPPARLCWRPASWKSARSHKRLRWDKSSGRTPQWKRKNNNNKQTKKQKKPTPFFES